MKYLGMNAEQIEKHKLEQERQMNDLKQRKMEDQHQKEEWEKLTDEMHRQMTLKERALSRDIRQINCKIREENEQLAKEQFYQKEHYDRVVNTNPPTEEYFNQFNTSSR
jgi:hypothetical protein